jgi:hypothetical protein
MREKRALSLTLGSENSWGKKVMFILEQAVKAQRGSRGIALLFR